MNYRYNHNLTFIGPFTLLQISVEGDDGLSLRLFQVTRSK